MSTVTYVLIVMLQLSGPNPHDRYGEIPTGVSATTADFYSEDACRDALEKTYAAFGNKHSLVTAICAKNELSRSRCRRIPKSGSLRVYP